jgi:hypothetical protein
MAQHTTSCPNTPCMQSAEDAVRAEITALASATAAAQGAIRTNADSTRLNDAGSYEGERENMAKEVGGLRGTCRKP